jgi:isopentenyl-diphosphate delta-isomerase
MIEEMGFDCFMEEAFSFIYRADVGNGLTEHEFDHVFIGKYNHSPAINHEEAESWKFMKMDDIKKDMQKNPDSYTVWFRIAFVEIEKYLNF